MNQTLFSLQGYVYVASKQASGKPAKLHWAGNCPEAKLALNTDSTDKIESFSGQRTLYGRRRNSVSAMLEGIMDEWSPKNLSFGFHSSVQSVIAGTVTAETAPTGLVVGDKIRLDHPFASSLVVTDSAGSPATVSASHYRQQGHCDNIVEILNLASYTQPFKFAYSYEEVESVALFTQAPEEVFVFFDGINTENDEPMLFELYRGRFDPFKELALINSGYGELPFSIAALWDTTAALDPILGGLGRIVERATP